ncbi:putative glycosyl [Erysiphe neolycopersici]|uniref:Putative glycosyl n=1 Tax=Erysiphe neolycopersici TaxID=212602 RepID=A0A420HNI5_9PEZI|nr:putative glycosyl [Erysiphe neolycopersici]
MQEWRKRQKYPVARHQRFYSEEMKYKGADDCLNLKLQMFYDLCSESEVLQQFYRAAFPIMLTGEALTYYYSTLSGKNFEFNTIVQKISSQYETEQEQQKDFTECSTIKLAVLIANSIYQTPKALSIPECSFACYNPAPTLEGFCAQLQSLIAAALEVARVSLDYRSINQSSQYIGDQNNEQFFADSRYHGGKGSRRPAQQYLSQLRSTKRCFEISHNKFRKRIQRNGRKVDENLVRQYLVDYEGHDTSDIIDSDEEEFEALMVQLKLEENENIPEASQYITAYGEIDGFNAISQLHDQSVHHALTVAASVKDTTNWYNSFTFEGIMIDTGPTQWSMAREAQVRALQKLRNITICLTWKTSTSLFNNIV